MACIFPDVDDEIVNAIDCSCASCNATFDDCNCPFDIYGDDTDLHEYDCICDTCINPFWGCISTTSTVTPHHQPALYDDVDFSQYDHYPYPCEACDGPTDDPFTVLCDRCNPNPKVASKYDIEFSTPENTSKSKNKTRKANKPFPTSGQPFATQSPVNARGKSTSKKPRTGLNLTKKHRNSRNSKHRDFALTKGKSRVIVPFDETD